MAARRRYNVKGTKDFIVLAGIFFFLCIWAIKDAWYPSPNTLEKHPLEVHASFSTPGMIASIHVSEGDSVGESQVLAKLRSVETEVRYEDAQGTYLDAKKAYALADEALRNRVTEDAPSEEITKLKQSRDDAKAAMASALEQVNALRVQLEAASLASPSKGVVQDVLVKVHDQVQAGEVVLVIDPEDHFYTFNKSLAIFSFIAFWLFLGIHILTN